MRKVVANTTPLIALANIGKLELLHDMYGEIIIPGAVKREILSEPAKSLVEDAEWICVIEIDASGRVRDYSSRLHSGEIEVMLLSQDISADLVIIDDNTAKKTAKYKGLNVTGTIGVLIKAKEMGLIEEIFPAIEQLINDGFYVDEKVIGYVLEMVGE